jgi:drug/metabolite transporter (DMT)-like permease
MTHDSTRHGVARSGWVLAAVSAATFGSSGALGRGLMDAGWSAAAAVAVRVLVGGAVLAPVAIAHLRGRWFLVRRHLPLLVAYGAVPVAGCQLAYFTAVKHVPVGVALLIECTAPVAVVGWLWLRHGQRPTRLTVAGAALGVAGLLLVIDLTGGTTSAVGVLWSLVAMAGVACYFILSSHDVGGLPATALAAGGLLVGGVLLLLAGVAGLVPLTASVAPVVFDGFTVDWWIPVVALGVVSAAVAYGCGIAGARILGARLASFVALSEVLAALVFAWLLLGQAPAPVQLLGGALVVAGVVAVRRGEPVAG